MKKIFIIAGEASGDLLGSLLIRELKSLDGGLEFHGLGGEKMAAEGVRLVHDLTKISALGLGDVLRNYFRFRTIFYDALREAERVRPNLIILIDYPGFNLRFAKKLNKHFPLLYYVSPQIWAWGARRLGTIVRHVSKMLVLFPFEKEIYEEKDLPVDWVGHPLLDWAKPSRTRGELRKEFLSPHLAPSTFARDPERDSKGSPSRGEEGYWPIISLLPGSRPPEVKRILPVMLKSARILARRFPSASFLLSEAGHLELALYESIIRSHNKSLLSFLGKQESPHLNPRLPACGQAPPASRGEERKGVDSRLRENDINLKIIRGRPYDLLAVSDFALISSGTATLEAAILGTPFLLIYKTHPTTYFLGRRLVRLPYIGLPNVILGKRAIPEFIQGNAVPEKIAGETSALLKDPSQLEKMKEALAKTRERLGEGGASRRAAEAVLQML